MNEQKVVVENNRGGLGLAGGLTLLFAGAKVFGYLDWSWWWVFSPIWLPIAAFLFACVVILLVAWVVTWIGDRTRKWRINRQLRKVQAQRPKLSSDVWDKKRD